MPPFRIAILSDIHAHRVPLDAVLHDLDHCNPVDAILITGDLTYGPSQPETIERLQNRKVIAIRGNSDLELLDFADGHLPDYTQNLKHFSLVRWSLAHTTPDALAFLHSLPEQHVFSHPGTAPIRLVHGSPRRINEIIHPDQDPSLLDLALSLISEPVLVFGHSHIPSSTARNGRLALNPGAVAMGIGQPCCASYAVLQWDETAGRWQSSHHRVPYSEEALRQEYAASGFLDCVPFGWLLLATGLVGRSVGVQFVRHAFSLAREALGEDRPDIPDAIWDRAIATFPWQELPIPFPY